MSVTSADGGELNRVASELGLDTETALVRMGGNASVYLRILRKFAQSGPNNLAKLDEMLASQNWDDFRIAIHGQKGALANIGATVLSDEAREMEMAAKNGQYGTIEAAFESFRLRCAEMFQKVNILLPEENATNRSALKPDRSRLPELLKQIGEHLNRLEHDEALAALDVSFEEPLASSLAELRRAVESFDYDKAAELIDRLSKGE